MKFFCLFISFVIVNVLAVTKTDYKKQVYISNYFLQSIQNYGDVLDNSVESLICLNIPITSLVLMLATPEKIGENGSNYLQRLIDNEKQIQNIIRRDHGTQDPNTANINFSNESLEVMGSTRRSITYRSLKRLLYRVEKGLPTEFNTLKTCYLIALLKTASDPRHLIKDVKVDEDEDDCHIIEILDILSIYVKLADGFHRIDKHTLNSITKLTNELS